MNIIKNILEDTTDLKSEIGKFTIYHQDGYPPGQHFNFSSKIEEVGVSWNATLLNDTKVFILSDPVELDTEKYGKIFVSKVFNADIKWGPNIMWVPSINLFIVEE